MALLTAVAALITAVIGAITAFVAYWKTRSLAK
jgi:hypothetical protein